MYKKTETKVRFIELSKEVKKIVSGKLIYPKGYEEALEADRLEAIQMYGKENIMRDPFVGFIPTKKYRETHTI